MAAAEKNGPSATIGAKFTRRRGVILDAFLRRGAQPSTEDPCLRVRRKPPGIGYATVHRTLKLSSECGIAEARNLGDGQTRYESASREEHRERAAHSREA